MWHVILGDSSASSTQLFRGSMQSIQAFSAAAEAGTSNAVVSGNRPGQTFIADYTSVRLPMLFTSASPVPYTKLLTVPLYSRGRQETT